MEIEVYKLFKMYKLVHTYKEYVELVRLRCVHINDKRIEIPTKKLYHPEKVNNIKVGIKKIEILE